MAQKTKKPYLETSPETFQLLHGTGYSDLDSPTRTGNPTPAILLPTKDSSSQSASPPGSPSDGTSRALVVRKTLDWWDGYETEVLAKENPPSGLPTEIDTDMLSFWDSRIPIRQKG